MTEFEKLITNPDGGSPMRSPFVMALVGVAIIIGAFYGIATDSIQLSKAGNGAVIHFSEHPVVFVLAILFALVLAGLLFCQVYKRYVRNSQ